ncbi:MAG TPA: tRNA (adenosine(37)-N6)-threonylcarbamoyltransferase complex dimerization subunit type 1 TsaB [Mucilaginibacter sp.]|jgi:tRNA threonylcarbamoyladenosine biosynthesis protein TsaB|nr:tRNA (adenosine(37)-N6)-threonylcarbamoyltransferase complex dimerization subunit type 1 TsaB [Mucilaginibacter sp.]
MSLILQIETATTVCSVALVEDGAVLACKEVEQRNIHAEKITVFIGEILNEAGKNYADLDAIAVSSGPGSYTGLRIGVSTAKGLSFALDKPLIAIETLAAMADGFKLQDKVATASNVLLCPMIDARRMEVFTAVFDVEGNVVRPVSAEIMDENSFSDLLTTHQMIFFGDGAEKCRDVLEAYTNAQVINGFTNSAAHLTKRAKEKYLGKQFVDVAYFEPYYLKDFIAGKKKSL